MLETRIQELFDEVETYKQPIQDAKDALASAERELDEELDLDLGKDFTGKWEHYVYPDVDEPLLLSLLIRRKATHVKCKTVLKSRKTEYLLLHLMVLKKEEKQFLQALEDLKSKMLICGHRDYEEASDEIISDLENLIRKELRKGKRIKLPSGKRARIDPARYLPERNGMRSGRCPAE